MYHVELRQFPHNFCRFNLSEQELRETILNAWARGEWIELGERKWSPHQASLTVLEGPELPVGQLSMGRGWRNAGRQSRNITEQLLTRARAATGGPDATFAGAGAPASVTATAEQQLPPERRAGDGAVVNPDTPADGVRLAADSLGLEVLAKLGTEPLPIAIVWQLARERYPERSASDCLKLAEQAIHSLVETRLVDVLAPNVLGETEACASGEQTERVLRALDSWSNVEVSASARIRRT